MSAKTEQEIREDIAKLDEQIIDAKREQRTHGETMKSLVADARKLTAENPANLEVFLTANTAAQDIARDSAKQAGIEAKKLTGKRDALWQNINSLVRATEEKEAKSRAGKRENKISAAYSPEWTTEVDTFNTVAIVTVENGALGIYVDDPEDDYDVGLTISASEEDALRDLLNRRHADR